MPTSVIDRDDARFAAKNLLFLTAAGLFLILFSRNGTADFAISGIFFDLPAGAFPLREMPVFATGGHTGLKWLALFIWLSSAVVAVAGIWAVPLRGWRPPLVFFCVTVALTTLFVALLKMTSAHSCPWDLQGFGGTAHWFPLFGSPAFEPGPGRCWPSGHSAGGFSLVAGYFAFRRNHRAIARVALAFALSLGALMSFVQMARGAHFLSHCLWSLWIAWFCSLVSFLIWRLNWRSAGR